MVKLTWAGKESVQWYAHSFTVMCFETQLLVLGTRVLEPYFNSHLISAFFFCLCVFPVLLPGESDAQTASPFPQCDLCLLCWKPAAAGADPQAVQHKAQTSRS